MERILRGKYLVRKYKTKKGEDVVGIYGTFYPNFDINTIKNNDEMWVSDIIIGPGGIRFTDPVDGVDGGSPEDFVSGNKQLPRDWKTKSEL